MLGEPFDHPSEVSPRLKQSIRGHNMAEAAIEMPCWILAAMKSGQSLARIIGGERAEVAAGVVVGLQNSIEVMVDAVRAAAADGYSRIKLKIMPNNDVDLVAAVREEIGPNVALSVDGNNAYTLDDIDVFRELDGFGLQLIEQPFAWDDFVDHAELQEQIQTAICLDESVQSLADAKTMHALRSARVLNIKAGRVGGFSEAIAIHDYCQANSIPACCGGMLESGIGRACNVALASLPGFTLPSDVSPSQRYWSRDVVRPEWTMNPKGLVTVPSDAPGLGREVDREYIKSLTVRESRVEQ
jgi:O-succinylbenzoate synthase